MMVDAERGQNVAALPQNETQQSNGFVVVVVKWRLHWLLMMVDAERGHHQWWMQNVSRML
jgi:hypothetical protein